MKRCGIGETAILLINFQNTKIMKYTIKLNYSRKTYTIREYDDNGKLVAKYRTLPQGKAFSEFWTENDIRNYLHLNNDYYLVK